MKVKYADIIDVAQKAVNNTLNKICQRQIVKGDESEAVQNELAEAARLYVMNIINILTQNGIEIEFPKEEKK